MKKSVVLYCSFTGNTQKVAKSIAKGLESQGLDCQLLTIQEAEEQDICFYDYDLVCFGTPSYNWNLPKPAADYLRKKFNQYKKEHGPVPPCAPKKPGKNALLFCTWSGPHTGMKEAIPCMLNMEQYFEHFGFTILDEIYVLSEFVGNEANSTQGVMGDIRGLPSEEDLRRVESQASSLVKRL